MEPYRNIVGWIDELMRIPAWVDPWPLKGRIASSK
jgi:hypothetical protein